MKSIFYIILLLLGLMSWSGSGMTFDPKNHGSLPVELTNDNNDSVDILAPLKGIKKSSRKNSNQEILKWRHALKGLLMSDEANHQRRVLEFKHENWHSGFHSQTVQYVLQDQRVLKAIMKTQNVDVFLWAVRNAYNSQQRWYQLIERLSMIEPPIKPYSPIWKVIFDTESLKTPVNSSSSEVAPAYLDLVQDVLQSDATIAWEIYGPKAAFLAFQENQDDEILGSLAVKAAGGEGTIFEKLAMIYYGNHREKPLSTIGLMTKNCVPATHQISNLPSTSRKTLRLIFAFSLILTLSRGKAWWADDLCRCAKDSGLLYPALLKHIFETSEVSEQSKILIAGRLLEYAGGVKFFDASTLHVAIDQNQEDLVEFLLNAGFDIGGKDERGRTALMHASETSTFNMLRLLLKHDTQQSSRENLIKDALCYVGGEDRTKKIGLLLERGAKLSSCRKFFAKNISWI